MEPHTTVKTICRKERLLSMTGCLVFCTILLVVRPFSAQAAEHWADSRQVGPFVVRANFSMRRLEPLFADLNNLQNDLVNDLDVSPAGEQIELLLFRDEWTYRSYLRRNFPHIQYRKALYIKQQGPGTVLVQYGKDFEVDVRHECTHALLHASLPVVPLWLDEGLAGYYEVSSRQRVYGNPQAKGLRWRLMFDGLKNVGQLERLSDFRQMSESYYRDCWAWVHFMLHGPDAAHDVLVQYLADISRGKYPGLFSQRLAARISRPTSLCIAHHRNWGGRAAGQSVLPHR